VLVGRARDLRTAPDGTTELLDEAALDLTIDYLDRRTVTAVRCEPATPGIESVIGVSAGRGFRRAVDQAAGWLAAGGALLGLLLDDVPVVTLVSGTVVSRATLGQRVAGGGTTIPPGASLPPIGVCAGWAPGGAMDLRSSEGRVGPFGHDTLAPSVDDPADPLGWHPLPVLPTLSLRRRRRLDVALGAHPGEVAIEGMFRDTTVDSDGIEIVIHEYGVTATVDLGSGTVLSVVAAPHVLPGPDCPMAAASAGRLGGRQLVGLRDALRVEMTGTTTCTHLTDQLRALADVHALVPLLPAGSER
jgi:Protein of unknown function (DUF2889)